MYCNLNRISQKTQKVVDLQMFDTRTDICLTLPFQQAQLLNETVKRR